MGLDKLKFFLNFMNKIAESKVVLSCRIEPDLKDELITEATEEGVALSSYIESLLVQRNTEFTLQEEKEDDSDFIDGLLNRVKELEDENTELKESVEKTDTPQYSSHQLELQTQVNQLEKEYLNLSQRYKDVMTEKDALLKAGNRGTPNWLSKEIYNQIVDNLNQLKSKHDDYTHEELLLSAVAVALKNDSSFFTTYTLKDFWKRNPDFINFKNQES